MARTQQPVSTPTPGPWENDASRKYYDKHVIRKNGLIIAAVHTSALDRTRIDAEANGRLLAAAPEPGASTVRAGMRLHHITATAKTYAARAEPSTTREDGLSASRKSNDRQITAPTAQTAPPGTLRAKEDHS